jgi:transcription elongation GreA/GreB family factor
LSTLDRPAGPVNDQLEQTIQEARLMARSNRASLAVRTIREAERRLREIAESIRQAVTTVPTAVKVRVVLGSIFLAFAQLIRPR